MMELTLMSGLLVKHFFADFPLQTQTMIAEKGKYAESGGVYHALVHGVFTFFIFAWFVDVAMATTCAWLDVFIHYHIDWVKQKLNKGLGLNPSMPQFWWLLGLDQLLHGLTYVLLIWFALQ